MCASMSHSSFVSHPQIRNNCYWCLQGNMLLLYPNKEAYLRNPTQGRKTFKLTAHMHVKDVAETVR